jgi:hypothetical protein
MLTATKRTIRLRPEQERALLTLAERRGFRALAYESLQCRNPSQSKLFYIERVQVRY